MADKKQNALKYGEVLSKCWEDEEYKKRFLADPEEVLIEAGFVVEEGVTYKVVEQPKMVEYIVLPHVEAKKAAQIVARGLLNRAEKTNEIIPGGVEIRIIQNTDDVRNLILPASPKTLTKAELATIAGGGAFLVVTDVVVAQSAIAATTAVGVAELAVAEGQTVVTTTTGVVEIELAAIALIAVAAI